MRNGEAVSRHFSIRNSKFEIRNSTAPLLQSANEQLGNQSRIIFDRARTLGEQSLIHDGHVGLDEHRRDAARLDIAKHASLDAVADHPRRSVDEMAIALALIAAAPHARDFALIHEDAEQVAPLIEIREIALRVRLQLA